MSGSSEEDLDGLPDIYLSPLRAQDPAKYDPPVPSDAEHNVWEDTDSEVWTALVPEITTSEIPTLEGLSEKENEGMRLGQREEIEGTSSMDSTLNTNSSIYFADEAANIPGSYAMREPEGSRESDADGTSQSQDFNVRQTNTGIDRRQWKLQRGETPGSDCPHVAGMGVISRVFKKTVEPNVDVKISKNELFFSPGGDEGFIVPGGVSAYYSTGSGSETDGSEWQLEREHGSAAIIPVRDAVEGADNGTTEMQTYMTPAGPENMERNSPAGLSTPDAEIRLPFRVPPISGNKPESVRPPVVGQSEEGQVQVSRKDLGATDGEESGNDDQKRTGFKREASDNLPSDIQQISLGSQSENTDSVNTVLDMSRGEVQGCETDDTIDTPLLSPSQIEPALSHVGPKPTFVVGGPIAPRGKYRQFQSTVRGRMQDVMASLELEPNVDSRMFVDREQFLSQPPLCPPMPLGSERDQEMSLTSMVSVESTNHPESSDRVTSPSVLSVSSAASSKRLEWDSGADVGYAGNTPEQITSSLSTLERIALGSYASVLRTEPEGTTYVSEKQKLPKKNVKSSATKSVGSAGPSRRSHAEEPATTSSRILRNYPPRANIKFSSSEEDFENRFSSPGNSPRRKPRRKPSTSAMRKYDLPIKSVMKTKKAFGRLKEVMQELTNESKASSLVELNRMSSPVPKCRSSSQQSLSYLPDQFERSSDFLHVSVTACSSTSDATTVCQSSKLDGNSPAESPTSGHQKRELVGEVASDIAAATKSLSSEQNQFRTSIKSRDGTWPSSGNEISSKSQGSSEAETFSDVKDTDGESCPSCNLVSDEEPVNLKAKKNSENAKNHKNISKQQLKMSKKRSMQHQHDDSSSSSSLQRSSMLDFSGSLLESQVSLQSCNNALQALSARLKERIQALLDGGTMKKVQDYNKLQDYVAFIGTPSVNAEECRLKQGVANVIMRMFGEIGSDDTDMSNTMNSESSESATPETHTSDSKPRSVSENTVASHEEANPLSQNEPALGDESRRPVSSEVKDVFISHETESRAITPNGTIKIVPYRPSSATRTYFMAVSGALEEGIVEAERGGTPVDDLASGVTARQDDLRGQAEGQRKAAEDDLGFSSSTSYPTEVREEAGHVEDAVTIRSIKENTWEDEESESLSAPALPREWTSLGRSQFKFFPLPGTATSDESSPRRVGSSYSWEKRSSWHEDENEGRIADASNWKFTTTRSERLYKDKLGTLHIAKQPPGYTDDRDSHQSESTSEHEPQPLCTNDAGSQEERQPYGHPWTSSGSESAYETIRERHRHVDEALASSFEFYSTSPRDARLLGYVSSEGEKGKEEEMENMSASQAGAPDVEQSPPQPSLLQPQASASDESLTKQQINAKKKSLRKQQKQEGHSSHEGATFLSNLSSHTDGNDGSSSQVSFIKIQKHRYVRRIQRYIDSLEKLERALEGQLGESIGSEHSFRRYVTEGRSHTESDSNNVTQTRDILGQSETASSSVISSDISDEYELRKTNVPTRLRRKDVLARSETHPGAHSTNHASNSRVDEGSSYGMARPLQMHSSLASSPRFSLTHRSSDPVSSRASTLRQIEKEVRMLALAEKKSRHAVRKNLKAQSVPGTRPSRYRNIRKMHREEPRGEENPSKSLDASRRGTLDSNMSANYSPFEESSSQKRTVSSNKPRTMEDSSSISDDESISQNVPQNQMSRQGDGRETRETKQFGNVTTVPSNLRSFNQSNFTAVASEKTDPLTRTHLKYSENKDFGQMFPSTLCLDADYLRQSVGVQTSTSLLHLESRVEENINNSCRLSASDRISHDKQDMSTPRDLSPLTNDSNSIISSRKKNNRNNYKQTSSSVDKRTAYIISKGYREVHEELYPSKEDEKSTPYTNMQEKDGRPISTQAVACLLENSEGMKCESPKSTAADVEKVTVTNSADVPGSSNCFPSESGKRNTDMIEHKVSVPIPTDVNNQKSNKVVQPGRLGNNKQESVQADVPSSRPRSGTTRLGDTVEETVKNKLIRSEVGSEQMGFVSLEDSSRPLNPPDKNSRADAMGSEARLLIEVENTQATDDFTKTVTDRCNREQSDRSFMQSTSERFVNSSKNYFEGHRQVEGTNLQSQDVCITKSQDKHPKVLPIPIDNSASSQMEMEITNLQLTERYQGSYLSSNIPSTYLNENETVRSANHHLLQLYSDQLLPYKNHSDAGSDSVRSLEATIRSMQTKHESSCSLRCKNPVSFEVELSNKENIRKEQAKNKIKYSAHGSSGVLVDFSKKNLTLQEALSNARPSYVREASERRALIRLKQEMRQVAQNHNHEIISRIPTNLQTPSTLQRFLYKPDVAPLFSYKDIREQNRRLYQLLPEASVHQIKSHRSAQDRMNRLMAKMYSQKLRKKVLKGAVSHGHKDIVTPPPLHRK
ncbi:hypothetical protein SK128_010543 [Halocaridina rubra]|uniref:ALMS motif domain-containing protein n=1 Tax=Halocaridina rubra TaxID=373956 RepID=A0AAN9AD54_HALRR